MTRDRWLHAIGSAATGDVSIFYLIHTKKPRFVGRVVRRTEPVRGPVVPIDSEFALGDFDWIDRAPIGDQRARLMTEAIIEISVLQRASTTRH